MDKWAEFRTAYQVAKLGTVSAAAEALGFHRATVNRHIDVLEEEIGTRIFIRHAKGYTLTELGEEMLKVARQTEALIDDLAGRAQGQKARIDGNIKLTILVSFARLIMQPVAEFRRANPHCRVCVTASESLAKLEYGEAHVALRAGPRPDHPDYIVREFMQVKFNLYAHDNYIQRYGMPQGLIDFDGHHFVIPEQFESRVPFSTWVAQHVKPEQIAFSSNNLRVGYEAMAAGIGIGFMSELDVAGESGYQRVLPESEGWSFPVWQVTHVDLHRSEKVQALLACIRDWLDARVSDDV